MTNSNIKWTFKEIVSGKTFLCILLSIPVFVAVNAVFGALISSILSPSYYGGSTSSFVINPIFRVPVYIACFFASAFALLGIMNLKDGKLPNTEENAAAHKEKAKFKWNAFFLIPVGYVMLFVVMSVLKAVASALMAGSIGGAFLGAVIAIVGTVGSFFLIKAVLTAINRAAMKKTRTNKTLILDIVNGKYDNKIPKRVLQDRSGRLILVSVLNAGAANTLTGAVIGYYAYTALEKLKKIAKKVAFGMVILSVITVFIGIELGDRVGAQVREGLDGAVSDQFSGGQSLDDVKDDFDRKFKKEHFKTDREIKKLENEIYRIKHKK